jgi:pSer/pThr/pTyr-binding forkhead associated (FHA) protein
MTEDRSAAYERDPLATHSASPRELHELLSARRLNVPLLVYRDAAGELRFFVLDGRKTRLTIGRRSSMDLPLAWDEEVSGLHAEVHCTGDEWTILDDGLSTNGTYVNGERLAGRRRLTDGDRIRAGRTIIAFDRSGDDEAGATRASVSQRDVSLTPAQRKVIVALCRPYRDGGRFAVPASNKEIASELFLSVDAVKTHLRALFSKFQLDDLAQNEKRVRLAEAVLHQGLISPRDL